MQLPINTARLSKVAFAVASALAFSSSALADQPITVLGTVGGSYFNPPVFADTADSSAGSSTQASVYTGVKVCFDLNNNGVCDSGEPSGTTNPLGNFVVISHQLAPLVAEISTSSSNNGHPVLNRNVFRATQDEVAAAAAAGGPSALAHVDVTPLSTEVTRAIENDGVSFNQAVANLAQRIGVSTADVLKAPTNVTNSSELPALLKESVIDTGRFELAAKFVDRGDTVGVLRGNFDCPGVASFDATNADACSAADQKKVDIKAAQNWAMNLEGIPRYDYVFLIIEENESLISLKDNPNIPYINQLLNNGSQFYNYYATGNPSEPNYLALGSGDDWGQTGDEAIPYPAITGVRANLSNAIDGVGLSWRHYEGSLYPSPAGSTANPGASKWNSATGGAFFDNPANSAIVGNDGSAYGSGLVAKKHNTVVWFADVVAQPDFLSNERSIAGTGTDLNGNPIPYGFTTPSSAKIVSTGNWDAALQNYANTNGITSWWTNNTQPWNQDQFKQDLATGQIGNYNVIVPDQDDDMHNTGVTSRADYWAENVIAKIQSSPIWKDPTKRVAIVVTVDEGESASTSCCGWNPRRTGDAPSQPVQVDANGVVSVAPPVTGNEAFDGSPYSSTYANGNHGHGVTMFGLLTNQQALGKAPHGHYDSDYYSHFSYVRTIEDMFGLADPGQPGSYMNRTKYTETFIEQNATLLPEFANSANPHFDAVRAMNHVYQFPAGVSRVIAAGATPPPVTVGPDADQVNLWAVK